MTLEKCPVCNGNGLVSARFYSHGGDYPYSVSGSAAPEKCRSCNGRGVISVEREIIIPDGSSMEKLKGKK